MIQNLDAKNQVIYRLNSSQEIFWYFESPYDKHNALDVSDILSKYVIFTDSKVPISKDETLIMKLKVLKNNKPKYTMQYQDLSRDIKIRSDNDHDFPHIDLEIKGRPKEKRVFDTDPLDYEASINTVLRYAERYGNPLVGLDYWLYNIVLYYPELIHGLFKYLSNWYNQNTSFTDIARLVSVELFNKRNQGFFANSNNLAEKLTKLFSAKFSECLQYERTHKRPLKISKNLIGNNHFPFPIITYSNVPKLNKVIDKEGNEVDQGLDYFGFTSYTP